MNLLGEKQKTKVISDSGSDNLDVDCYIKKKLTHKLIVALSTGQKNDFNDFEKGYKLLVKVYTPGGIVIFNSEVTKLISSSEMEILYNAENTKVEDIRITPRYNSNCPITIFRPLMGNIETNLIDISIRGLRFYSEIPLDVNSEFEIMLYLSDTIGRIILTGKVLDKTGLPEGVHRMIIEKISFADRQKLTDYCLSLAE
ncbi:MAG: PilZ domain-containing protein [Candidatus Gastranaerophilales bacterium]|nr:PilZ domain-containing protein [Candidatus Gastranaerophilales bacterium]